MCQRREVDPAPGREATDVHQQKSAQFLPGAMEEAAPVDREAFDALRPIPNDRAILHTTPIAFLEEAGTSKRKAKRVLQAKKKGRPIPAGVTFFYYGRPTTHGSKEAGARGHRGVMTMAMRIAGPGLLHLGFAFCNAGEPRKNIPPDIFCKVEGRDKAMERLFDDPVVAPYLYEPRRMAQNVAGAVAVHEFKRLSQYGVQMPRGFESLVPHWTKTLPQRMKARRSLKKLLCPSASRLSLEAMAISSLVREAHKNYPIKAPR